jgi:cyclopropane-fatty-acyl-phospholipid synthase
MLLAGLLKRAIRNGTLDVIASDGTRHRFGDGAQPALTLKFHTKAAENGMFFNPWMSAGESYMDGTLTIEEGDLADLFDIAYINMNNFGTHPLQGLIDLVRKVGRRLMQVNPAPKSRQNVAHHYDLSRKIFELFLDPSMQYSCAYYTSPDKSLEEAQAAKLRHLAAKLLLKPGQRVLDIGSGWGGLAIHLAEAADVEVLGVTLSTEQLAVARERAAAKGLEKRVKFELIDYRALNGSFDRIVSVGMFEHVGLNHYPAFFQKVEQLLDPQGVALLHSIARADGPGYTNPWIRKYIFPGGYSPAVSEVVPVIEKTNLWITDIEILRGHYAETLKAWRQNFNNNRAEIEALTDARFCRMWEFYLVGSEISFRHRINVNFQIQMALDTGAVPATRDYITAYEQATPLTFQTAVPASKEAAD